MDSHELPLAGKVALVTGASRGLGRAIALALGRSGAGVAVTDLLMENPEAEEDAADDGGVLAARFRGTDAVRTLATAQEIAAMGRQSRGWKMDVTRQEEIESVVSAVAKAFGGLDILVNNAGIMENLALQENQTEAMWNRDVNVNLTGAYRCIRAAWPHLKAAAGGRIVNISSFVAFSGAFAQPGYGAAKAGLVGLTRSLALEGARYGITVNAVLPGFIETEALMLHDPAMLQRIRDRIALKRLGTPEEVAATVAFLASPGAGYITGAAVPVTGGADLLVF